MSAKKTNRLQEAFLFAGKKHEGQYRKGGLPYITHPLAVAEMVKEWGYDEDVQIAALFHDLLEDTDATENDIVRLGGTEVLKVVKLLTKTKDYVMAEYIAAIKSDPIAKVIKAADRLHNLRCAVTADETFRRKYIQESREWYLDFSPEIEREVQELEKTIK